MLEAVEQLDNAVKDNKQIWGNILLEHRVFYRVYKEHPEYLISLNNIMIKPHYWGHIFWQLDKYVSCIIALDYWLNPAKEKLFELYHYNLEVLGHWYPTSGNTLNFSNDIVEAVTQMSSMIKDFSIEQSFTQCNYLITQIYPFPNIFDEEISFEQWKISKE